MSAIFSRVERKYYTEKVQVHCYHFNSVYLSICVIFKEDSGLINDALNKFLFMVIWHQTYDK